MARDAWLKTMTKKRVKSIAWKWKKEEEN